MVGTIPTFVAPRRHNPQPGQAPKGHGQALRREAVRSLLLTKHAQLLGLDEVKTKEINKIVRQLINNQNSEGMWGWWNSSSMKNSRSKARAS